MLKTFCNKGFKRSEQTVFFFVAIVIMAALGSTPLFAQTVRTVGTTGNYTTLKLAFDAINAGTITGAIELQITTTVTETASAALNASGTGSANYSSILIYPTSAGYSISGNISAAPLINLNGADNVTLDGRVNHTGTTKSLTLLNTNTSGSVVQFINDASSNILRYCTVQGVNTSATGGLILFGSGAVTGNDNNSIENCDLRDGASTPTNIIYSAGLSTMVDNSNITISNSNLYNYYNAAIASTGILVASNSSAWTITGNRFYQAATRTATASAAYRAIYITTALGVNYNVSNNVIGFSTVGGTGTSTYTCGAGLNNRFCGIEISVGTTTPSNIQGNTIAGVSLTNTTATAVTTAPGIFNGISVLAGAVNIGSVTGNTIGTTTGVGSITVTSSVSPNYVAGIYATSSSSVNIQNNAIGAISLNGTFAIGHTFHGINTTGGGNFTISANTIGSTVTANSIAVGILTTTTTGVCTFNGITNGATGNISITGNTVQNTTAYGTAASVFNGILNSGVAASMDITGNNVIAGRNVGTGTMTGIANTAVVPTLNINNNILRNFSKTVATGAFTGISNSGAVTTAININDNQLGNATGGLISYSVANSSTLLGISNTGGAVSCALSIQNNNIQGITYTVAGTHGHTYLSNTAATLSQNISNNTFTALSANTSGSITFIANNIIMPNNGVQNVNGNNIVTSFAKPAAGGTITLFSSTAATNNSNVTVNNNNNTFSNITFTGATTMAGWVNTDAGLGNATKTISGNTFSNWTGGTSSITVMNVAITSPKNATKNNAISTISGASSIYGITTGAGNDSIYSNTIQGLISTGGTSTIVNGIAITGGTVKNVFQNTIFNLQSNGFTSGSNSGIAISSGAFNNVYRNKIYTITSTATGITTTGSVNGILISGTVTDHVNTLYNNIIGAIQATASNRANTVRGIALTNTGARSANKLYYNSIYLNTTSSAGTFGSSGVYQVASTTSTTAALDMRNNIIVNASTPKGTAYTVAFRRDLGSANQLANYATTSDNNLFYAGTPGTYRLIFHDGTAVPQTIAAYKTGVFTAGTIAPRDQASVSENPPFLSTTASDANFLHINTGTGTQIESGATAIPNITNDFDGTIRQGNANYLGASTTAPDLGALEGNYTKIDNVGPSISYSLLTNTSCLTGQTLVATISDASGVNNTAGTRPRLYYKRSGDANTYNSNVPGTTGWKWVETTDVSSPYSFTMNYALLNGGTGVVAGQTVQYFIVAQDLSGTPKIGMNSGTFTAAPTSVALTVGAFPINGTINSFNTLAGLSGTVTIGSTGTYPTLTGTGGLFSVINTNGLSGNLVANIISTSVAETGANSLNAITYGCGGNYTLTIKPNPGVAAVLSGSSATTIINLNGADNVLIDGLNTGGSSLTIQNTNTTNTASTIRFINDATNNTITNCTITGSGTGATLGTVLFSTGISTGNDGNTLSNNTIKQAGANLPMNAICSAGSSIAVDNSNNIINNNIIQDYYNAASTSNGVYIASNSSAWAITGNRFFQSATRTASASAAYRAIYITTTLGVDYNISNNIIGFSTVGGTGTSTYTCGTNMNNRFCGIEMSVGTSTPSSIQGNTIAGINLTNTTTTAVTTAPGIFDGISVLAGAVNIGSITGNTIGTSSGVGSITVTSSATPHYVAGIYVASSANVNIQNNSIGAISLNGAAAIGHTFHGINTTGAGNFTITGNTIGSTLTANSIAVGILTTTTTGVCTFNGITNAATGAISMIGNTIQNCTAYGTSASVFNGISNLGIAASMNITSNNVIAGTNVGTGTMTGISNTAVVPTLNINNNILRNFSKTVATGAFTGISNSGAVTTAININDNQLGNATGGLITYTLANASTLLGISNTGGAVSSALSIQNNNIQGVTQTAVGSNAHTYLNNTAATLSQNISNNTFTNLSANTTGSVTFIANNIVMPNNGVQNVNGNSVVTAFAKPAVGGTITLFNSTATTNNANVTVNNNNNNFSNITFTGATTMAGWNNTDAGLGNATKTISGNTFSNWTGGSSQITVLNVGITSPNNATNNNSISTISCAANIYGIITGAGNDNIFSNTIQGLNSTGATALVNGITITGGTAKNIYLNDISDLQANSITTGSVNGISVTAGATNAIYRNKIHTLSSSSNAITTGTISGIMVSGTTADLINTIYNNRIGNLLAPAANAANPICGINLINSGLRSTNNVLYNTVLINATSTGAQFGTSSIYHAASTVATTGTLNLRNNILVNASTAVGTGTTVVFRRSAGTAGALNNYASTSNNNLFYAGYTSIPNHFLYSDGVSTAQTLASYKAGSFTAGVISPRDQATISENPTFLSTTGSSSDYLKINPANATFIESGAANLTIPTTDFEAEIRAGNPGYLPQSNGFGTTPDIGADEFDGRNPSVFVLNSNELSDGIYTNLGEAFAAINAQDQTGKTISVTIVRNTIETSTATLNQGTWTSLSVYPTLASLSITGNLAAPLINLNGADGVTLDGRVNQTGSVASLTIENTSTSSLAGTSTIRFFESAENNIIEYCNLKGSTTSTSDGILSFTTSSSGNGNDNNLIDNCSITNSTGNRPVNALYSAGSSSFENNLNTVSNTSFYNFLNASASSNGINIAAYSTDWTLTANHFYETTAFVPTSGSWIYRVIRIDNASGVNFSITGNYIGGQATLCGGSAWSVNAGTNHQLRAISLNVGTSTASSVQNNFIRNWSYLSANATPWKGIEVNGGAVNIGTVTANNIGANTGTGSITLTAASDATSSGIEIGSTGTVSVSKNNIGSITLVGSGSVSHSFNAIRKTAVAGTLIINNNVIGSTSTGNSIYINTTGATSSTAQHLRGIYSESTGSDTISANTVANLNNAYAGSLSSETRGIQTTNGAPVLSTNLLYNLNSASLGSNGAVIGIELNGSTSASTVSDNTIYGLSNGGTTFPGFVAGIYFTGNAGSNVLNANFIRTLTVHASSTAASIYGIRLNSGANTGSNNIISLGGNTATTLYGIYENGSASNDNTLYFNTIYLTGSLGSGITNKSYALYSNASTNVRDVQNNIFSNTRSTTSGSSLHYGAYFNYGTSSNLTLNYNDYYTPGTGGVIGYYNGSNKTSLPIVAGLDANSYNVNPSFSNAGGILATNYKVNAALNGAIGLSTVLDYETLPRGTPPNIGAFEFYSNRWKGTVSSDFGNALNWTTSTVPLSGAQIVFDDAPLNDCVLDINRTIGNLTNIQSAHKFVINGKQLTINGGLYLSNGAQLDAKAPLSTVVFAGTLAKVIPEGAFVDNTFVNLTINNAQGVTSEGDLIVESVLNLLSANPSGILGCLDIAATKTLTLGSLSSITGNGDVTGVVRRTSFVASTDYAFTNQNTKVNFGTGGTLPTEVQFKLSLGAAPTWKTSAMNRVYEFIQTGGSNCFADVRLNYLASELNANDENKLVFWTGPTTAEWGYTELETTNNWLSIKEMPIDMWASSFGTLETGIATTEYPALLWDGSASTTWTNANNWTPRCFPNKHTSVTIPDATTTTNDPAVSLLADVNSLSIQNQGILNAVSGAQLSINATSSNGWSNNGGTFNPGNSTVLFKNAGVTLSGTTNFNNLTVQVGSSLTPLANSVTRIAGLLSNSGTLNAAANNNVFEFNGGNQTIINPNGALAGYYGLTLSGTGTKTLPTSALSMAENFTLSGSASVAPTYALTIGGDFTLGSGTTFTAGNLSHSISGDLLNNGASFVLTGSTIVLEGTTAQIVGGSASTTFNHLTIDNNTGVTLGIGQTINGQLTLTNGLIHTGSYTLTIAETGSISGGSSASHVDGRLAMVYASTGSKSYPIGASGNYRPLTLQVSALTGTTTLTARQVEDTIPGTLPAKTYAFTDRYWELSQTGGSGHAYYLTLDGTGWDRVGTPMMLNGDGLSNTSHSIAGPNYINATPFTAFGNFGLGETDISWTGSTNNDWFTASNWSSNLVPSGTFDIVIPSSLSTYPIISGSSPAEDVTIGGSTALALANGATLTLESGPLLTFESGSTITTGVGSKLVLQSDARYKNFSTSTPTLQMQRSLTGTSGWRMVSSPVASTYSDQFKAPLVTQGFTGSSFPTLQPNLLWWLESDGGTTLQSWRKPTAITDNLVAGRGYFHYVFDGAGRLNLDSTYSGFDYSDVLPTTMTVTGVEPYHGIGTFDFNLTYTTKSATQTPSVTDTIYYDLNSLDQGWNLIGNPTASTIDWDAATGWTKTNVDNTIYIWDPSALSGNGDYLYWNGSTGTLPNGMIPPFQSFWVHTTAATTLKFNNDVKSDSAGVFLRKAQASVPITVPITLTVGDLKTTSYITFSEDGVTGPDPWDGYRLEPMSEQWISLYSLSSSTNVSPLVINHLPLFDKGMIDIPMYFDAQLPGSEYSKNFSLEWTLPDNWPSGWNIGLQDHRIEQVLSMTENSEYEFMPVTSPKQTAKLNSMPLPVKLINNSSDRGGLLPPFSIIVANGLEIEYMAAKPHLLGNFPNPFETMTNIRFSLPKRANVRVEVFSSQGSHVVTLVDEQYPAGITSIPWTAKNIPSGLYFIRFICGETVETRKAVLIH